MKTYLRVGKVISEKAMRKDAIAEKLGVHPSLLSKMLTGERPWSDEQRDVIANILDTLDQELFVEVEEIEGIDGVYVYIGEWSLSTHKVY